MLNYNYLLKKTFIGQTSLYRYSMTAIPAPM